MRDPYMRAHVLQLANAEVVPPDYLALMRERVAPSSPATNKNGSGEKPRSYRSY
jgi:hypothetical protein